MARPRRRRRRDAALALAALVLALPFCLDLGRRRATRASGAPTDAVAVWDRGVYTPRRRPPPEPRAPALVRAWRRGRVDWHDVAGGDERAATDFLCPVPLTVRGTQALVSFAPLAFKLFYAARQNAVLRRSSFPPP